MAQITLILSKEKRERIYMMLSSLAQKNVRQGKLDKNKKIIKIQDKFDCNDIIGC